MHRREAVLVAVKAKLDAYVGLSGVTILQDDPFPVDKDVLQAVEVEQGSETVLQYLMPAYLDCELAFNIRLHVKVGEGVRTTTLLNNLHVQVVKALTPGIDGSVGVAGASNLSENGTSEPTPQDGEVPSSEMLTYWTIQYRRDVDDPENLT